MITGWLSSGRLRGGLAGAALLLVSISACEVTVRPATRHGAARPTTPLPTRPKSTRALARPWRFSSIRPARCERPRPATRGPSTWSRGRRSQAMLDATDAFVAKRPDFPIKIGVYTFSSSASRVLPIQPYNRDAVRAAIDAVARPRRRHRHRRSDGRRAAGPLSRRRVPQVHAGRHRRREHQRAVARRRWRATIFRKSEGAVQIYFVAFDTSAEKFAFLEAGRRRRDRRPAAARSSAPRSTGFTRAGFSPKRSTPASASR